ncbi:DUF5074 domain-containing protein [Aequorivita sp. Q41]|uniref:DUF5074 domain-containing protein n=1 Tax=Aequorivita sp. Q41 TaxID=3153300 RepID=UPI0032421B71
MKNYSLKSVFLLSMLLVNALGFTQDYTDGVLVLNEGLIGTENSSISYIKSDGTLENNIFSSQNGGMPLGDTGQGMAFAATYAYVVLNYSNEVKVINKTTFELVTTITDQMVYPRYIAINDQKAYVTNWGDPGDVHDDYIAVIDLITHSVIETISVVEGPEEIIYQDGKLFVAHQGGYGFGNTISIIDTASYAVTPITVGDIPSSLKIDANYLYVLCSGNPDYSPNETSGKLVKIDLTNYQNSITYTFPGVEHPAFLGLDDMNIYYVLDANIYKMALSATALPTTPFINTSSNNVQLPYGFDKIDNTFYLADGIDYVSNGKVFMFDESGNFTSEYTVGPLPNGFYKNQELTAGTTDLTAAKIVVYPNPTSGNFKLNSSKNAEIIIYDVSGRLIKKAQYVNIPISLRGFKPGVYLVQIEMEGKVTTQKLLVQ